MIVHLHMFKLWTVVLVSLPGTWDVGQFLSFYLSENSVMLSSYVSLVVYQLVSQGLKKAQHLMFVLFIVVYVVLRCWGTTWGGGVLLYWFIAVVAQ
jgi:hypothetical protein